MVALPGFPRLEGLFELDQKGVDIRPTLLRVLTYQYVASPHHSPEEERHYTELALRLIEETDIASRTAVAERLARHRAAPRAIILQLARDVVEVAEPILRYSPCLTRADCEAIASERGPRHAELIAERGKPPRVGKTVPNDTVEHEPKSNLTPMAPPELMPAPPESAPPAAEPAELCELFFAAGSLERRLIVMTLDFVPGEPRAPSVILQRADIWRIESAALAHNTSSVVRELEHALGVSAALARRIVIDELGEPIVVAAKAMNLPTDVVQRMLLFMNPSVGQSIDRVYQLSNLYSEISVEAARRLIAIWSEAARVEPELPAEDMQSWQDVAETARRALSELSQPQAPKREMQATRTSGAHTQRGRG